jgi:hypothetical protein
MTAQVAKVVLPRYRSRFEDRDRVGRQPHRTQTFQISKEPLFIEKVSILWVCSWIHRKYFLVAFWFSLVPRDPLSHQS